MLNERDKELIVNIKEYCERILFKEEDSSLNSLDMYEILAFNLIQIGECANKLSKEFKENNPDIEWQMIIGMRNMIVHGYSIVRPNIVKDTCIEDIPNLLRFCNFILSCE